MSKEDLQAEIIAVIEASERPAEDMEHFQGSQPGGAWRAVPDLAR
jgi:hypothetical protein